MPRDTSHDHCQIQTAAEQVHAVLSGTSVPPQLDEFILTQDEEPRVEDLRTLGWTEARLTQ